MTSIASLLLTIACAATPALFDTRQLIEQALDEPTRIRLENIKLADAINEVTRQTGVRIVMPLQAMQLVSDGPNRVIKKVHIEHVPLRHGLTSLLDPLGMTWTVREDGVEVIPKDAVACLGRPPTPNELELLGEVSAAQLSLDERALDRLRPRIQFQVPELGDTWGTLKAAVRAVGAGPGDEVLTAACEKLGWAWCLSGERIVVSSAGAQIRARLRQPVSVRMNNRPLLDVLSAVAAPLNLPIRVEPGALAALPQSVQRNFSLNVTHQSAEQVLDGVAAYTGLGYFVEPQGIVFFHPQAGAPAQRPADSVPSPGSADPYVGKIVITLGDGRTFEWLIRRSELPEDLRQMRETAIQETIDALRLKAATPTADRQ